MAGSRVRPRLRLLKQPPAGLYTCMSVRPGLCTAARCTATLAALQYPTQPAPARPGLQQVIVLAGPTAVGKTQTSLALAERLGGEIVSADSVQVYRGLDVGSDKIRPEEQRGIPHHLLDILPLDRDFSAACFFQRGRAAVQDILQRGRVPIIVGGTGLYLRWFVHGRPATPRSDPAMTVKAQATLDAAWAAAERQQGSPLTPETRWDVACRCIAAAGDPDAAARVGAETNNTYRLLRVLEVVLQTGQTLSSMDLDMSAALDYDFRCFFLHRPRLQLAERIDARVEQMMERGLLLEAAWLLESGLQPSQNCATRAIGYRQAMEALQGWQQHPATATPKALVQLIRDTQAATRQFCTRQTTWFRGDPMYDWVDATQGSDQVVHHIAASIAQPQHTVAQGDGGRLTKEEQQMMKRYTSRLARFSQPQVVEQVLQGILSWLRCPAACAAGSAAADAATVQPS